MKKFGSIKLIMSVLALGAILLVPMGASAAETALYPDGMELSIGQYDLDLDLGGDATSLEFEVVNGVSGKNMVSSVKITMLRGKDKIVVISPDQFSQKKFSNAVGTLGEEVVKGVDDITLAVKVAGPKNGTIRLFVTKNYVGGPTLPPRPTGW